MRQPFHAFPRRMHTVPLLVAMALLGGCETMGTPEGGGNGGEPGVAYASVSVKCGSDVYTVTTGNKGGRCTSNTGASGSVESATCDDGQGNSAAVSCKNGIGACNNASGSGECSIKLP